MPEERKIQVRVTKDEYRALNNRRHQLNDTSFQAILYDLLMDWLARGGNASEESQEDAKNNRGEAEVHPSRDIEGTGSKGYNSDNPGERKRKDWHALLDRIIYSGHLVAINSIVHNLFAFDLLVSATTTEERGGKGAELPSVAEIRGSLSPDTAAAYEEYLRATGSAGERNGEGQGGGRERGDRRTG